MSKNFWKVEGFLTTTSNLHIGDGRLVDLGTRCRCHQPTAEAASTAANSVMSEGVNLRPFVRDHLDSPFIPGSELKGVLVNWWKNHVDPNDQDTDPGPFRNSLLGQEVPVGAFDSNQDEYFGGKVTFCDATMCKTEDRNLPLPHFCSVCGTWVRTNTSIDRNTGSVLEGYLHQTELVPVGQRFHVTLLAKNLGGALPGGKEAVSAEDELAYLISLMDAFNGDAAPTLGGGTANGCGRLSWKLDTVETVTAEEAIEKALHQSDRDDHAETCHFAFCERIDHQPIVSRAERLLQPVLHRVRLGVELTFNEGFLVRDPTQSWLKAGIEPLRPEGSVPEPGRVGSDSVAIGIGDEHGRPIVPAESLRGVLRSRAERILRTFIHPKDWCHVVGDLKQDVSDWDGELNEEKSSGTPSLISQLFGASGWGSLVEISDFKVATSTNGHPGREPKDRDFSDRSRQLFHQDFVAINRITGGAASTRKFDCLAAYGLSFRGTVEIDLSRTGGGLPKWAIGLLALVLMDGIDGDLSLGYGKAKSLGRFMLSLCSIDWPDKVPEPWLSFKQQQISDLRTSTTLIEQLRSCVEALFKQIQPYEMPDSQVELPDVGATVATPHVKTNPESSDNEFLNPYHFVPMLADDIFGEDLPVATLHEEQNLANSRWRHVTHSRWVSTSGSEESPTPVFTGRIDVKITPESPLVIGGRQVEVSGQPNRVTPFQLPNRNGSGWEPAIPATSMRGMVSSLIEAATNSALRVLTNDSLSRRSLAGPLKSTVDSSQRYRSEALPAVGMLKIVNGKAFILPLCLPPLRKHNDELIVEELWRSIFPDERGEPLPMRAYLQAYRLGSNDQLEVRAGNLFRGDAVPDSFHSGSKSYWYCRLQASPVILKNGYQCTDITNLKVKKLGKENKMSLALGQRAIFGDSESLRPETTHEENEKLEKAGYVRGILRVFGIEGGKGSDLPQNHLNEYFIPLSREAEANRQKFDAEEAVASFERACFDHDIYLLKGMRSDKVSMFSLRDGDIVFFDAARVGNAIKVTKLAVSSIWREPIGSLGELVARTDPRLLPFGYQVGNETGGSDNKTKITLAEQMFGFVEEREPSNERNQAANAAGRALAGRIQFRHGRPTPESNVRFRDAETLRILASPKLPSPSMYIKPKRGRALVKPDVKEHGELQGRKFYLHGTAQGASENAPWSTRSPDADVQQKVEVRAIDPEDAAFEMAIHFDNLSAVELGALAYALRPTEDFRHKLGMGKPLGLGKTRVDLAGFSLCDRRARYRDAFSDGSFKVRGDQTDVISRLDQLGAAFRLRMDANVRNAIELIGGSTNDGISVQYPQVIGQSDLEKELYKWFVANDAGERQALTPINASTHSMPTLRKISGAGE